MEQFYSYFCSPASSDIFSIMATQSEGAILDGITNNSLILLLEGQENPTR